MIHLYRDPPDAAGKLCRVLRLMAGGDTMLLLGDGVLCAGRRDLIPEGVRICVLGEDLAARGLECPAGAERISMGDLVRLVAEDPEDPVSW